MFGAFYGAPWLGSHSISGSMTSLQVAELRYFCRILLTIILNQNYAVVASFHTLQFGMGQFYFTPSANEKYHALIQVSVFLSAK